ncbi:MAG TPA: tetratricopeptide repeat protein, partial [Nakamurella sp.]
AAGYIVQTGMDPAHYLHLFRRRRAQLLRRGVPDDHRGTIETTWRLAHAELSESHPAAVQFIALCSVLAPEIIPLRMITAHPDLLPGALAAAALDELELEDAILQLRRFSLLSRTDEHIAVHLLVQAVVAHSLPAGQLEGSVQCAAALLRAEAPTDFEPRDTWREWEPLIPHIREIARSSRNARQVDAGFIELTHAAVGYLSTRGQFTEALDLMRDSHELMEASAAGDEAIGRSLTLLGESFEQCGLLRRAIDVQEAAIKLLQVVTTPDDPWLARALGGLGRVLTCHAGVSLWKPSELADAEQRFVNALRVLGPALGQESPVVAKLHGALGQVRQDRGDLPGARVCLERALAITESVLEPGHPEIGHCHDRLAFVLALSGEADRSLRLYKRAARLLADSYAPDHPWVAWSLSNRAMLLLSLGRTAEALSAQNTAHQIFRTDAGEHPAAVAISSWRLARMHAARGNLDQACELLEPAISSASELLGPDHGDVMAMQADLAGYLRAEVS